MKHVDFLNELRTLELDMQTDPQDTDCYSYDNSNEFSTPSAVIFARNTKEVSAVLKAANQYKVPVTARGAGTSVVGGALAAPDGVILSLAKMDKILEIDEENLTATMQAGVVTYDLHRAVEKLGLFYPPDPGSVKMSTIGGNVAVNAGGPHCFKYGVTEDYVMGMEVVLADGKVTRFGSKNIKDVSGLNLGSLFIGSEGILGVITEVTVRLIALPEEKRTVLAVFDDLQAASQTVSAIVKNKLVPATMELMDQDTMRIVEKARLLNLPVDSAASVLIASDGSKEQVAKDMEIIAEICRSNGATEVRVARDNEEQDKLWEGRRAANGAMSQSCKAVIVEDASVPRNKLTEMILRTKKIAARYRIFCPILGHSGDGNVHPHLLLQELTEDEWARADKAIDEIFRTALDLGGTITGEHGIGLVKKKYLKWQFSPDTLDLMKILKTTLDPNYILNPQVML